MSLKHGTGNISVVKHKTTTLSYVYHGSTRVFANYLTHTVTFGSATLLGIDSITCNRISSPRAEAATGALSSGMAVYTDDVLEFTVTSSSGYYVYEASARDSTSYTETVVVAGNVDKQYHAVQKKSYSFSVRSAGINDGNGYVYTASTTTSNAVTGTSYAEHYRAYAANIIGGKIGDAPTFSVTSSSVQITGHANSANTLVRGTLYWYTYANSVEVAAPVMSDLVWTPFEVTFQNPNNFNVLIQVQGYWESSTGTHTLSSWTTLGSISGGGSTTIYPSTMDDDAEDDAEMYSVSLEFRFAYSSGGTTYYSNSYPVDL